MRSVIRSTMAVPVAKTTQPATGPDQTQHPGTAMTRNAIMLLAW